MLAQRAASRAYLSARLGLTERQLATWKEFEAAAAEGDEEERRLCVTASAQAERQSVVQRLEAAEDRAARGLVQMRKNGAELRKLIATLSPEQLQLLDRTLPLILL